MPKLVHGDCLPEVTRREVLRAFVHRLTTENGYPERNPCHATIAPVSDREWLHAHAFYLTARGHLASRPAYCEPHYLTGEE